MEFRRIASDLSVQLDASQESQFAAEEAVSVLGPVVVLSSADAHHDSRRSVADNYCQN